MNKDELIGIVVCGGESKRMGNDKSLINYHGKAQRYFIYDMLKTYCKKVYISCNKDQEVETGYDYIVDKKNFAGHGPVSGLLSAIGLHPENSILFIGCDYPFLKSEDIKFLIDNRNFNSCISYYNSETKLFEPLLTIYENNYFDVIINRYYQDKYSLREFLELHDTYKISPHDLNILRSVDTKEEYLRLCQSKTFKKE